MMYVPVCRCGVYSTLPLSRIPIGTAGTATFDCLWLAPFDSARVRRGNPVPCMLMPRNTWDGIGGGDELYKEPT